MSRCIVPSLIAIVGAWALAAGSPAAEHRIPPPRPEAQVKEILAQGDPVPSPGKLNVVLLAGPKDHGPFEHDYPLWQKRWKVLLGGLQQGDERVLNTFGAPLSVSDEEVAGAEAVELSTAWVWPSDEQWEQADLVVMFSAPPPWTPERLAQLEAFLKRGGGFVSIHMSLWQDSPELAALLGMGKHRATWFRHGPVKLELTGEHDIIRGLPRTIDLVDESYFNFQGDPTGVDILATGKETRPGETQVRDEPLYWTSTVGEGRVFVCIPGHYMWSFDDPYFRILLLRGMAWAAGESPFRFDPLVLRGARVYRPAESEAPRAADSDLILWLDATDRDTLKLEQGDQVAAWKNKAAGRNDAVASEGSSRPRYVADGIGGKGSVRFDGQNDVLRNTRFGESATEWTIFLVANPRSNKGDGVPNGFHGFFSATAPGAWDWATGLTIDMGGFGTDRLTGVNVESNKGTGAGNLLFSGSDFGIPRVLAAVSSGLETTLYAEGEPQLSRLANDSETSLAEIRVGARFYHQGRETGFLDGDIAEVLLYKKALPAERVRALSQHLQSKYSVPSLVEVEVPRTLDEAFAALPQLDWTLALNPVEPIDRALRSNDPSVRRELEERLATALEKGLNPAATDYVTRRLAIIGTSRSVPVLAPLLTDAERGAMACAALVEIDAPEAGAALLEGLGKVEGPLQQALVDGLGLRREVVAVQPLLELLPGADKNLSASIAGALGEIGDVRAVDPLLSRDGVLASALLKLASRLAETGKAESAERIYAHLDHDAPEHLQASVLAGRVLLDGESASGRLLEALRSESPSLYGQGVALAVHKVPERAVGEVLAQFSSFAPPVQRALLGQSWRRFPSQGRTAALAGLKSDNADVRADALRLLSAVGVSHDITLLASLAAQGQGDQEEARLALRHLAAEGTDAAVLARIPHAPRQEQLELVRALTDRRAQGGTQLLLSLVDASDGALRLAAIEGLQVLGDETTVAPLVPKLLAADNPQEQAAIERALWLGAERADTPQARIAPLLEAYNGAATSDRAKLLPVLGRLGGDEVLAIVEAARSDEELRSAAVRALANWPDATVAPTLLEVARDGPSESDRLASLRGYIRVVTLGGVRSADETFALLKPALELIERPEEHRLVVSRLPAIRCKSSLELAATYIDHSATGEAELGAILRLAEAMLPDHPDQARDVMARLLPKTKEPALRARIERALARP